MGRAALLLAGVFLGCASLSHSGGNAVEVSILHHSGHQPPRDGVRYEDGAVRGLVTQDRVGVTVSRGVLVLGSLELRRCDAEPAWSTARQRGPASWLPRVLRGLSPVGRAHAHAPGSALVYGTPMLFDLMAADRVEREIARFQPPDGTFCALRVAAARADSDAPGIDQQPEMLGHSLILEGTYLQRGEEQSVAFEYVSTLEDEMDLPLDHPLEISAAMPRGRLLIDLDYGMLMDGIDFEAEPAVQEWSVIQNLLGGIQVHVCEPDGCKPL